MNTGVRCGALVVLLVVSAACGGSGPIEPTPPIAPVAPTAATQPPVTPSSNPQPAPNFPPPSGPSRTFVFDRELSYPVADYTKQSRFVLYDNGAFVLQYPNFTEGYRGGYMDDNGVIEFQWEGTSSAGPWGATGTLAGDSLTVRYNLIMQLTDFDDAVYKLTR